MVTAGCSSTSPAAVGPSVPGGGSSSSAPRSSASTTSTTALQVIGALTPGRVNLAPGDLPAGWAVSHATEAVTSPGGLRSSGLLSCLGRPASAAPVAGTPSSVYADGPVTARSDLAYVTPTTELSQEVAQLHATPGLTCLAQAVTGSLSALGPLSGSRIASLGLTPGPLDSALGVRYTATSPKGPVTEDVYFLVTGGNLLTVAFQATGAAPSLAVEHAVVAHLVGQL